MAMEKTELKYSDEFEVRSQDAMALNESKLKENASDNLKYLVVGVLFGILFVKAEIISWFRIQEMFRFQSFQMFGVIGTGFFPVGNNSRKPY